MIAKPPHDRKLGLGGVALTMQRGIRHDIEAANAVRDEIEAVIIDSGYLGGAPFSWVMLIIRYGLKNDEAPVYQRVSKKDGNLPLAIEVDCREMVDVPLEEVTVVFKRATLRALVHAGRKYKRPTGPLEEMLTSIPD